MKIRARVAHAGDRLVITEKGKRSSWHINEIHIDRSNVHMRLDRVSGSGRKWGGNVERREEDYGPNHRIEIVRA